MPPSASTLPVQLTGFVGRESELATAHALVPVLVWERQWEEAERLPIEAEQAYRDQDYAIGYAYTLDSRAFVALQLGNLREAVSLAHESLRTDTQNQSRWQAGRTLRTLGAVAHAEGELERAAYQFGAAAGMYEAIGVRPSGIVLASRRFRARGHTRRRWRAGTACCAGGSNKA